MSAYPMVSCGGLVFSVFPAWECPRLPGPGVYMLCRRTLSGSRAILYVGETSHLAARLGPGHEHWNGAVALGMNEVLVHLLARTEAQRLAVETRLRRLYPTPLNRQRPARQEAGFGLGVPPALLTELLLGRRGLGSPNAFAQAMARPPRRNPFNLD